MIEIDDLKTELQEKNYEIDVNIIIKKIYISSFIHSFFFYFYLFFYYNNIC